MKKTESGYTLVELMMVIAVLAILSLGAFNLFVALLHSAIVGTRQAVASTLATNQMEYLKSLPYDSLAVAGGPIASTTTVPATITKTVDGDTYTITTAINYIDDAYDGCFNYPTQALKQQYCQNYPPPAGAPTDQNPQDYKYINVTVTDKSGLRLASLDTHVAALVAETASTTGALFVTVLDGGGDALSGATVTVINNAVSPAVNASENTDENGIAIFYGLPPNTGYNYQISASMSGYSSLTTIAPSGSLVPAYPSKDIFSQNSSSSTLTLYPQGANSLVVETTDVSGNPLPGAKVAIKGGYKKYTDTTDTSYYYNATTPATDSSGLTALSGLVPQGYFFCGDDGGSGCSVGSTPYYLAAAVPYGGNSPLEPINVPTFDPSNPPATTFAYSGNSYLQKVRLLLTSSSSFPRVQTLTPYSGSLSDGSLSNLAFTLTGANLSTNVSFVQGGNSFPASCTGTSTKDDCTVNLSGASVGNTQLVVQSGGQTLTLPAAPLLGGILVSP